MKIAVVFAVAVLCVVTVQAQIQDYLVKMPPPEVIYLTPDIDTFTPLYEGDRGGSFGAWSFTMMSLAGLAALDATESSGGCMVWVHSPGIESYPIILDDVVKRTGAVVTPIPSLEAVVALGVEKGWVKGYILYRAESSERGMYEKIDPDDAAYNNSANVATNLAGHLGGIIVEERAEPVFKTMGLHCLLDVRDKDERWCFENHKDLFTRKSLHLLDPKAPHMRDYAIATRSMCVFGVVPLVDEALQWLEPNAPTLGWNGGDENVFVAQLSRHAHFTTASNWIMNLPVMSCLSAGQQVAWEELQVNRRSQVDPLLLDWPEDTHFTSFVLSDGDNVQWFIGNFINHPNGYWQAEHRGAFPFGWTMPVDHLSQVAPSILAYLARTASPNDQAITFPSGYYYPDAYGSALSGDTDWYAERVRMFAERTGQLGVRVLINIAEKWDDDGAMHGYRCFAQQIPDIAGVLAMQYHPYNAGRGAVAWVDDNDHLPVPVVTPRFAMWSGLSRLKGNGSPALVAKMINEQPHEGLPNSLEYFDWTIVHAWSSFKQADTSENILAEELKEGKKREKGEHVRNAYEPTWWCVQRLAPHVRVVSPEELLWRIRIHSQPAATLDALAKRLQENPAIPPHQQALLTTYREQLAASPPEMPEAIRVAFYRLQDVYLGKVITTNYSK